MNNRIGRIVKHVWNDTVHVWHIFWVCHKLNSLPLGPIQPSSPSTKELHGYAISLTQSLLPHLSPSLPLPLTLQHLTISLTHFIIPSLSFLHTIFLTHTLLASTINPGIELTTSSSATFVVLFSAINLFFHLLLPSLVIFEANSRKRQHHAKNASRSFQQKS